MCKAFNLTPDYVLHKISYANLTLLSATLPDFSTDKDKDKGPSAPKHTPKTINGDDPKNWNNIKDIAKRINNR